MTHSLSGYFGRVAAIAALIAVVVAAVLAFGASEVAWRLFEAGLSPELRADLADMTTDFSPELMAEIDAYARQRWQDALVPVSILIGLTVGGWFGARQARRLLRGLDTVAAAAARLARGDTSARALPAPTGIDEIDSFSTNFNEMAQAIERSERHLRDTNAAIAHELRTPLTVLIGTLSGMVDGLVPATRDELDEALTQAEQIARIVEDLRLLTLARAGRFELRRVPVDLAEIAGAVARADALPGPHDLASARVDADPQRIRQILGALVDNARRYGGGEVSLSTATRDGRATLSVADRGPGLSPADAARAFDRFWRAEASRSRETGGSGLGLAVVQMLAEAHGGTASHAPRHGGGAVFTVTLPARPGPDGDAPTA